MNLVADIGNSFTKAAIFNGNQMVKLIRSVNISKEIIDSLVLDYPVDAIIVSSVAGEHELCMGIFSSYKLPLYFLNSNISLPFVIGYSSPETLGSDRIAGIAGAHNKFAGNNVLVIDAGTAITYDLLMSNNSYPGGNISPGLNTRFRSLHQFTDRLPLVEAGRVNSDVGTDTESAIRAGVQMGVIFEINEYIRNFIIKYKEPEVIITGGDSEFLKDYINFSVIFAPELIMEGLNHILNYNVKVS